MLHPLRDVPDESGDPGEGGQLHVGEAGSDGQDNWSQNDNICTNKTSILYVSHTTAGKVPKGSIFLFLIKQDKFDEQILFNKKICRDINLLVYIKTIMT